MTVTWEGIKEGDSIPELGKNPGISQLVKYSAGSGDFNPVHHDFNSPHAQALGTVIVHGRFKYASMGELVSNWLNHQGRIKIISCQYRGMDYPDKEFVCKGTVERKWQENGEKLVELSISTSGEDGISTTIGNATVIFN